MSEPLRIAVRDATVSGLLDLPADARWLYVCAHGAGAGMRHVFLEHLAATLGTHGIATLRYNFLYMEAGKGRGDPPPLAPAAVRAGVAAAGAPRLPLPAAGESFWRGDGAHDPARGTPPGVGGG